MTVSPKHPSGAALSVFAYAWRKREGLELRHHMTALRSDRCGRSIFHIILVAVFQGVLTIDPDSRFHGVGDKPLNLPLAATIS